MRALWLVFILLLTMLPVGSETGEGPYVHLRYAVFDPLVGDPDIPPDLHADVVPAEDSYYIVQFHAPIRSEWKSELESLGAEILDYIPDFAFITRMTPETAERAADLAVVRWVGDFHPAYRISPELLDEYDSAAVNVRLFPGESATALENLIRAERGRVIGRDAGAREEHLTAVIPSHALTKIARHRGVAWIETRLEYELHNNVARGIMTVSNVWSGVGLYGEGEIVAVCDTGLDTGNLSTMSADFAGRIEKAYALGRATPPPGRWDDPHGHGTHVAGSVLGSGVLSGSNPSTRNYSSSFAGVAPEARLVFQSILDRNGNLGGLPSDLNSLFQPPYDDGARVHTNSWGAPYAGAYTTHARNTDMFTWNNTDMVIVFSAGNEGIDSNADGVVDLNSMGAPATAKNCISVGATENYRLSGGPQGTYGQYWASKYPVNPIKDDRMSNNAAGMAAFGSRGPCKDGRIKPDISAPGTNVISCRSHVSGSGTLWGVYNSHYLYGGGTSMSAPLVAGAAALAREYYRTQRGHTPSAALVKATLINGATDVYPGQYGTGSTMEIPSVRPTNVAGWGRLNLANSIIPEGSRVVEFVDYSPGLFTDDYVTYNYVITDSISPLKITLVWTDYPASTSASKALVNDLDLIVTLPNGAIRRGNNTTDRINNVEGVDIFSPAPGNYSIQVYGHNISYGPQPFALVVSGSIGLTTPIADISSPTDQLTLFGPVTITGTASGDDFSHYVLEYSDSAAPTTWHQIGLPGTNEVIDGVLGNWETAELSDGAYTLRLRVIGAGGVESIDTVTVTLLRTSLSDLMDNPNNSSITITGKVVSAGPQELGAVMYIQEPDRSRGLRVDLSTAYPDIGVGDVVTVTGTLQILNGERRIVNPTVAVTGSQEDPVPLGLVNRDLGGESPDEHTPGVTDATGLYNIGLLVKTWGKVMWIDSDFFTISDNADGSIKVDSRALARPTLDQYVVVTGISSAEADGSTIHRVIRPRTQSDLVYY